MAKERNACEESLEDLQKKNGAALLAMETLRAPANPPAAPSPAAKSEEGISLFWRVFGGTILSIVALLVITAYNQVHSSLTDLRRDLNQLQDARADLIKKDDFNSRFTSVWNSLKELQKANHPLGALTERSRLLDLQIEKQIKTEEEARKDLHRKLEQYRKGSEDDRKEMVRKVEEQLKSALEEQKELRRKMEDYQRQLQALAERLAAAEGRRGGSLSPMPKKAAHLTPSPFPSR